MPQFHLADDLRPIHLFLLGLTTVRTLTLAPRIIPSAKH